MYWVTIQKALEIAQHLQTLCNIFLHGFRSAIPRNCQKPALDNETVQIMRWNTLTTFLTLSLTNFRMAGQHPHVADAHYSIMMKWTGTNC